jgi:hypothetical protein
MSHYRRILDDGPWENMFFYDPAQFEPAPVRTLADMSEEEIVALEKRYGCPVRRPNRENRDGTASERGPAQAPVVPLTPEDLGGELVGLFDLARDSVEDDGDTRRSSHPRRKAA